MFSNFKKAVLDLRRLFLIEEFAFSLQGFEFKEGSFLKISLKKQDIFSHFKILQDMAS